MALQHATHIEFEYGRVDRLSPLVRRVICRNPGPFTYTGTVHSVVDSPALPKPAQARLPIVMGGGGKHRTPKLAARYASDLPALAALRAWLDGHADAAGVQRRRRDVVAGQVALGRPVARAAQRRVVQPHQADDLATADREAHLLHGRGAVAARRQRDAEVLHLEDRSRHACLFETVHR